LENGAADDGIRPWFWVLVLFAGPMLSAVANQWYMFLITKILVHAEAVLTELVFEHSLRVCFTTEGSKQQPGGQGQGSGTVAGASSAPGVSMGGNSVTDDGAQRPSVSEATTPEPLTKGKAKEIVASTTRTKSNAKKDANLIGKINNLVTSDLNNITRARAILSLGKSFHSLVEAACYVLLNAITSCP
jgi:hypothetical protein